jgi:Lon protease-like protein
MEVEIHVPDVVPVMTLPHVAFFPQSLLPLRIFEPRYRQMLDDVLETNRIFAVAGLDLDAADTGSFEPPHRVAGIGLVRACQKDPDGTSRLILQGLCRVAINSIVENEPYRKIRVTPLASQPGAKEDENAKLQCEVSRLIKLKLKLSAHANPAMADMLAAVKDPEVFADIAAFNLCKNAALKQKLLETLEVNQRLALLLAMLRSEIGPAAINKDFGAGPPPGKSPQN